MLQKEFEERTGVNVSLDEYSAIETVYMASDLDKDEFCHVWCRMNSSRIKAAKKALAEKEAEAKERTRLLNIVEKIDKKRKNLKYDYIIEPLTVDFLSESEIVFLLDHNIMMNISYQEAVDYGYPCPRHYKISETSYHIKKYLKIA